MSTLQSSYTETVAVGYAGMVANGETSNRISRTIESAAGIGFGKAAFRGAGDHGIVVTQALTGVGSAAASGNVGTSTISASPAVGAGAKVGRYVVTQLTTSATGELQIEDPYGVVVGEGVVGTAMTSDDGVGPFTVTSGGTATAGDKFYIDVSGSDVLGITIATTGLALTAGATADKYAQYDNVPIMTQGSIWVEAGAAVTDGAPVYVDTDGNFIVTATGIPCPGWVFDTSGADGDIVRITRR